MGASCGLRRTSLAAPRFNLPCLALTTDDVSSNRALRLSECAGACCPVQMGRLPDSSLILETRRTCANNLAEHAGEMARILKTDSESHLQDVMLTIPEFLLGAFDSL